MYGWLRLRVIGGENVKVKALVGRCSTERRCADRARLREDLPFHLALNLARTRVRGRPLWSLGGKTNGVLEVWGTRRGIVVTRAPVKSKTPLSLVDNGGQDKRVMGLEPTTFTLAT